MAPRNARRKVEADGTVKKKLGRRNLFAIPHAKAQRTPREEKGGKRDLGCCSECQILFFDIGFFCASIFI